MADALKLNRSSLESWLSAPRYKRYLEIAEDDDQLALSLYLWNIGLAQAVLRDVSFFEIALRNAYDRALKNNWSGTDHWLFDEASPVRRPIHRKNKRGQEQDANRINRNTIDHLKSSLGQNATSDKVISNLTLGFWAHMTDRNHERDLWIPAIHKAWPKGASREDINRRISEINRVRNRAAHHEYLFATENADCATRRACLDAVELFKQLAPEAYRYVYTECDDATETDDDEMVESPEETEGGAEPDAESETDTTTEIKCSIVEFLDANPAPCAVSV